MVVEIINKYINTDGCVIPILQDIQKEFGYLSYDNMVMVANSLDIPLEELYSTASFYTQFKFNVRGKYVISLCLGTVCYVKGANDILEYIKNKLKITGSNCSDDGLFSIDTTRCLGCCGMAPVMKINDDIYGNLKLSDLDKILESYK